MTEQPRSKLSNRLAAAAQRITATRVTDAQQAAPTANQAANTAPAAAKPARNPKPTRQAETAASDKPNAQPNAKRAKGAKAKGSDEDREWQPGTDGAAIATRLRAMASRPELASLVTDAELAGVWRGIVTGAQTPGPSGSADRMALARALGLPLHQLAGAKGDKPTGAHVRDRLERAVQRTRRQPGVTPRADDGPEAMETAA